MKKYLLITLISLFNIRGNSQSIFPGSGTVWLYETRNSRYAALNEKFTALGDTIIKGQHYTKVYRTALGTIPTPTETIVTVMTNYIGSYRTENEMKRVFYFPKDSSKEHILLDFSLKVGDTLPNPGNHRNHPIILEKLDTVLLFCQKRIRQKFIRNFQIGYNIEGVGSFWPSFDKIYFARFDDQFDPTLSCIQTGVTKLEANYLCKSDNCLIDNLFKNEIKSNEILIYPNPSTGIFYILNPTLLPIKIYNSLGKLVLEVDHVEEQNTRIDFSNYPKGYYTIKNGNRFKKVIVE